MIRNTAYAPPFPYFGGKSAVADIIWAALGNVVNYVEPFFGSGAILFLRPGGAGKIETVNDADGFVANFWRAMQKDVDAVAEHADNPVNECDLHARNLWLIGQRERITDRLCGDPDFFDAKAAGWWCWGLCSWIGSGWCSGKGPWISANGVMVLRDEGSGGQGVNRQLPQLGANGQGVNRKHHKDLREYLLDFSERLKRVRVCCGDWSRVCGTSVTFKHGLTGVFLDPPYAESTGRDMRCYAIDCGEVAHRVREWAIEQGRNPLMRIVIAGYDDGIAEHAMPDDWHVTEWQTQGGFANLGEADGRGNLNKKRERLWMSPYCIHDAGLFGNAVGRGEATT